MMQNSAHLLRERRFWPLFATQALGAFNDSLFKQVMVLYVTYQLYSDVAREAQFSALVQALFILPFFLLSALSGQLADIGDKAAIIRRVKLAEIVIMLTGAAGLLLPNIPLMLAAVLGLGIHSTFFGPIKYAILPQHLREDEVLGGTGLVEAGTYLAILGGTILAGFVAADPKLSAVLVLAIAAVGLATGYRVPPAPPAAGREKLDWNLLRASVRLVSETMHVRRLFLAILSISFFWTIGAVLVILFPPLVKNVLSASEAVASLFAAVLSVGIAIGSVLVNRLLKNEVSARYSPVSVIVMGGFVLLLHFVASAWHEDAPHGLMQLGEFLAHPLALLMVAALLGVAIAGGMFVVPLYAFLTTTVAKSETARVVAANNIVNAGAMTLGATLAYLLSAQGFGPTSQLMLVAAMCLISAWLARLLVRAC